MFSFFLVSAFLLLFEYGNGLPVFIPVPVRGMTEIEGGCHKFIDKIFCESGDAILSTAKVGLWEFDNSLFDGSDFITAALVASDGTFMIGACACVWDYGIFFKLSNIQVYLEFRDACPNIEYSYARLLKPGIFLYYEIPKRGHQISVVMSD